MEVALLKLTPLYTLLKRFYPEFITYHRLSLRQVVAAIQNVADPPFFAFVHNTDPHVSINEATLTEDCRPRTEVADLLHEAVTVEGQVNAYLANLQCVNADALGAVDDILARDSTAIIVIQSDHGPGFGAFESRKPFDEWTNEDFRIRYGILNLMRLPDSCPTAPYQSMSPVNTFRLIFSCLTGEPIQMLEDISYLTYYGSDEVRMWHGK